MYRYFLEVVSSVVGAVISYGRPTVYNFRHIMVKTLIWDSTLALPNKLTVTVYRHFWYSYYPRATRIDVVRVRVQLCIRVVSWV